MRGSTTRLVLAVGVIVAGCASAPRNPALDRYPAGVTGRTTVLYYDVHGSTFEALRADMRRLGPKVDGASFVGETRSPMGWTWRSQSMSGATCMLRNVSVAVNAQITLPRWTPPADTEPGLVAEWTRFITALETHEAGHKDISAKAAREIISQLSGFTGYCPQINAQANEIARAIVLRANEEQKAYDLATRHGFTQGTSFGGRRFAGSTLSAVFGRSDSLTLVTGPRVGTIRGELPAPLDRVWAALPDAYAESGLAINAADSSAHVVGDSVTVRGAIGAVPLSEIIDCGEPPSGRNADSVDVSLFVTSRLEAAGTASSTVINTVQAVARPAGAAPLVCRSRSVIERRLLDALRRNLSR